MRGAGDAGGAAATLERGLRLIEGLPFERELRGRLGDQLASARRAELAGELHELAEEVRALFAAPDVPPARRASIGARCEALWQRRDALAAAAAAVGLTQGSGGDGSGDSARGREVAADLQDVVLFAVDVRAPGYRADALRMLEEAEAMFGASPVLAHRRELLQGFRSPPFTRLAAAAAPGTARGHATLGRSYLAAGDLPRASSELALALRLDPGGKWPNFYYGLCAFRLGRHDEAVAAFSVCVGTSPDVAGCFYNRGLAYAALGRDEHALRDYDRALHLDPAHAAAALNRGMLHYARGRLDRAVADLTLARNNGADPATVHYDLALAHRAAKQPRPAADHAARVLEHDPAHVQARQLLDALGRETGAVNQLK